MTKFNPHFTDGEAKAARGKWFLKTRQQEGGGARAGLLPELSWGLP